MINQQKFLELFEELSTTITEVKILYELSDKEMTLLTWLVMDCTQLGVPSSMMTKVLKAAAHIIEANDEITDKYMGTIFND